MLLQLGIVKCFSRKHHKCVSKYNQFNALLITPICAPCSSREAAEGDHQGVPEPLVAAGVEPLGDGAEPAVLGRGEDLDPNLLLAWAVACE